MSVSEPMLPDTTLAAMSNWLCLAFAMNLAYPILVNFGQFSGALLRSWVEREMLRVIPALAENRQFNQSEFVSSLSRLEKKYTVMMKVTNSVVVSWSLLAALALFVVVALAGYYPTRGFPGSIWYLLALGAAVPCGLIIMGVIYAAANWEMRSLSAEYNGVLRFNQQAPLETVEKARRDLQEKIRSARLNGDPI